MSDLSRRPPAIEKLFPTSFSWGTGVAFSTVTSSDLARRSGQHRPGALCDNFFKNKKTEVADQTSG